jgi:hypothetical protein
MGELEKTGSDIIGFIDPYIVNKCPVMGHDVWLQDTKVNVKKALERHRHKEYVLLPYNFE